VLDSLHGWPSPDGDGASAPAAADGSGTPVEREVAELAQENANLRVAIDSRAVIEQAKGALMLRYGLDQDAAFAVLKRWSQHSNIKLHTIAETLVDWAAGNDPLPANEPGLAGRLEEDLATLFGAGPSQSG
jgi:ANTAR domain